MKNRKGVFMRKISRVETIVALLLAVLLAYVMMCGNREFRTLQTVTEQYIECENAAKQLQDGSDYLTEQVRLYAMTRQTKYRDLYFEEATVTQRRENALESLRGYFEGTETFELLEAALNCSEDLMNTEYYAMRLVAEATDPDPTTWPAAIRELELTPEDAKKSGAEKLRLAQTMVCDDQYQNARTEITGDVSTCVENLISKTRTRQQQASAVFTMTYRWMEFGVAVLIALMLFSCWTARKLVVEPLNRFGESIREGKLFPELGAEELRHLARTYNSVFEENKISQQLIRHEAEHDGLTDLLNRSSFDKLQQVYENGTCPYALIIVDVDVFKSVNDTYGHAAGDEILKKVALLLKNAFRSIDYVCRIGGDEFAVIMVQMTSDLKYTIENKIAWINEELSEPKDGLPAVSLSVGVAFTDRENPGESIFKDADHALYQVKEHGKHGCGFYSDGRARKPETPPDKNAAAADSQ